MTQATGSDVVIKRNKSVVCHDGYFIGQQKENSVKSESEPDNV